MQDVHVEVNIGNAVLIRKAKNSGSACTCPQILCVDDNAHNIWVMGQLLQNYQLEQDTAADGSEALEVLEQRCESYKCCSAYPCNMYSLIFMDCNMPIMDGYSCATKI